MVAWQVQMPCFFVLDGAGGPPPVPGSSDKAETEGELTGGQYSIEEFVSLGIQNIICNLKLNLSLKIKQSSYSEVYRNELDCGACPKRQAAE